MAQITTAEAATALETDGRTLRKFLRATVPTDEHPGKGARWAIDGNKRAMTSLRKNFAEWSASQATAKTEKAAPEVEEEPTEELTDGPTDSEVQELEDEIDLDD